jgi:hypothetical protein
MWTLGVPDPWMLRVRNIEEPGMCIHEWVKWFLSFPFHLSLSITISLLLFIIWKCSIDEVLFSPEVVMLRTDFPCFPLAQYSGPPEDGIAKYMYVSFH